MKECIFCQIVEGKTSSFNIYEDEDFIAILDIKPIRDGHILVIPKTHFPYLFDLDNGIYTSLLLKTKQLSKHLEVALQAKRIGMFVSGVAIAHTHVHLVPVYKQSDLDLSLAKPASKEELSQMQQKILKTFHSQ